MARVARPGEPGGIRAERGGSQRVISVQEDNSCMHGTSSDAFLWTEFVDAGSFACFPVGELESPTGVDSIPCFHIHAVINRASDLSFPRECQHASPFGAESIGALPMSGFLDPDLFDDEQAGDTTEKQLFNLAESTPVANLAQMTVSSSFPERGNDRIRSLMEYCTYAINTTPCSDDKKYPFQRALNRSGANERRLSSQSLLWSNVPDYSVNNEGIANPTSSGNTKGLISFFSAKAFSPTESKNWVSSTAWCVEATE